MSCTKKQVLHRAVFWLDDGEKFSGWTSGEQWNGWGCPRFEKEEADRLAEEWNEFTGAGRLFYDAARNAYVVVGDDEQEDVYEALTIECADGTKREAWAIGAWCSCWNEAPPADVDRLAREFCALLREWIGPEKLALAAKRNEKHVKDGRPQVCASHDFCDANQAILDAFERAEDREAGVIADAPEMDRAWNAAKRAAFKL